MIEQRCDRCGRVIKTATRYRSEDADVILDRIGVRVSRWEHHLERTEIDLCIDCSLALNKWLKMEVEP